jgi:hypothetical protein
MRFNRRHILLLLLVLSLIVVMLPIPIRYSFVAPAKIYPLREWKLSRGVDEGVSSQTYDYETDALSDYRNYRFERGDIAELKMNDGNRFDTLIRAGDTVAVIESYFIQNEILRLKNLRDVEIANLGVLSTGEKQSLVDQARRQYNYASQQLELEKKNFARQERLFRDSVITASDYDYYENAYKLAEINAQVAYNALLALETGEKDPVLRMTEQKIEAYDKEVQRLENQRMQYTITVPFEGLLTYDPALGGVLKVSDNRRLVLKIPVAYEQSAYLKNLHSVTFSTPDNKFSVSAAFKGFEENVNLIQNQQVIIAKAVTTESSEGIYPGMIVQCRIYCDKVTLLEYLKRNFSLSF